MSKRKYFDEVITLFKGYENKKKALNNAYEKDKSSGVYSNIYLNDLFNTVNSELREESVNIASKIYGIKERYMKEVDSDFDLTARKPDPTLVSLVNSGITMAKEEFENLAQKYKGSYIDSRILHDFADKSGFELRNLPTREDAELAFDNFSNGVRNSLYIQNGFPVYPDSGYASIKADKYLHDLENPPMDCYKKAENFEEAVANAAMMENADKKRNSNDEIDDRAFLDGFYGRNHKDIEKTKDFSIEDDISALSDTERKDALSLASYRGHYGKITKEEIDYIKSEDYKRLVEERNADAGESE